MKKIIAPKGYRILRAKEILLPDDFYYDPGFKKVKAFDYAGFCADHCAQKYGYSSCYIRKVEKPAKPKKPRPKKSLAQIYEEVFLLNAEGHLYGKEQAHCLALQAVASEVRKRIKQQKEHK